MLERMTITLLRKLENSKVCDLGKMTVMAMDQLIAERAKDPGVDAVHGTFIVGEYEYRLSIRDVGGMPNHWPVANETGLRNFAQMMYDTLLRKIEEDSTLSWIGNSLDYNGSTYRYVIKRLGKADEIRVEEF